ncbi:MAG: pyridoxal phosphate-dependent aminotransferase, partial [Deltaproteobacteria bacterium]
LSRHLKNKYGLDYSPEDQILITAGVSEGVDLALRAIANPGDKILIPTPSYVSYGPVAELAGAKAVYIDTRQNGFKLTPALLERAIDKKAKALVLNYPANPTGISYTRRELSELNKILLRRRVLCLTDEIYGELTYDFEHTPFATLSGAKDNTIYLDGFSKTYAMTGWRIGFACGPKEIIAAMTKIHQYTLMCVSITAQMAACEALHSGKRDTDAMKREYKRRREFIVEELNRIGLKCHMPQGAFYVLPSVESTGLSAMEFCQRLLKEQKVAVVPGVAFGKMLEKYVRISYAASMENIKEALNRIDVFLKKLKNSKH